MRLPSLDGLLGVFSMVSMGASMVSMGAVM